MTGEDLYSLETKDPDNDGAWFYPRHPFRLSPYILIGVFIDRNGRSRSAHSGRNLLSTQMVLSFLFGPVFVDRNLSIPRVPYVSVTHVLTTVDRREKYPLTCYFVLFVLVLSSIGTDPRHRSDTPEVVHPQGPFVWRHPFSSPGTHPFYDGHQTGWLVTPIPVGRHLNRVRCTRYRWKRLQWYTGR